MSPGPRSPSKKINLGRGVPDRNGFGPRSPGTVVLGPYNYQKALYTGKHFYLPKSTEKTHARRGLYALNLNLNSLLVKRQIDNPSPGAVTGGN